VGRSAVKGQIDVPEGMTYYMAVIGKTRRGVRVTVAAGVLMIFSFGVLVGMWLS
jgi:hypothetical protein